ncbi:MAG TPA: hypothetical protein VN615_17855 [Gaiellales bacterium]|nr:hypothetical protein [Gaiellales bacterium]
MSERGQATIELVVFAALAAMVAVGVQAVLVAWAAQGRAQGIADQAAVVVAEGRPVPAELRHDATIQVRADTLVVTVPVRLAGGLAHTSAVARAALP